MTVARARSLTRFVFHPFALGVGLALFTVACSDSQEPRPPVPDLPPARALYFSVGFFDSAAAAQEALPPLADAQHNDHFQQARVRAEDLGAYPQAVLMRAFHALDQVPAGGPAFRNGGYEWSYSWSLPGGAPQGAVLRAEPRADSVTWRLRDGAGADWAVGVCAPDSASEGTWLVHNTAAAGAPPALDLTWETGPDFHALRAVYVQPGHSRLGSVLEWEVETVFSVHRLRFIHAAQEGAVTAIDWNAETLAGRLQAHDYHNGVEACWNNELIDNFCSPEF